jgi:hypothetical protein
MIMMEAMSVRFGIGLRTFGKAGQGRQGQGGSSFLKKGTKKLLLCWLTRLVLPTRTEESKSFLVLFFKKELLCWSLPSFGSESL